MPGFCVLTAIKLVRSALPGMPLVLRQDVFRVASLVLEGAFLIQAHAREFIDAVEFFSIICQCSFEPALAYLSYRRSREADWDLLGRLV